MSSPNLIAIVVMILLYAALVFLKMRKANEGQRNECRIHSQRNHCAAAAGLSDVRAAQTGEVLTGAHNLLGHPLVVPARSPTQAAGSGALMERRSDRWGTR